MELNNPISTVMLHRQPKTRAVQTPAAALQVLLAVTDPSIGKALQGELQKLAYDVTWIRDVDSLLTMLGHMNFAAIIFDANVREGSGLDILQAARRLARDIPILLVCSQGSPGQKAQWLDDGADDCVMKPFYTPELMARLRALIRRSEMHDNPVLKCGSLELDPVATVVRDQGKAIILTAKEFLLLKHLMVRAGKYCAKRDIESVLYGDRIAPDSNAIEVAIYSLRKKIGTGFIRSLRGMGYMIPI